MNNHELYTILKREVGNTGIVYFRDSVGTYCRVRDVYVPARIMVFEFDLVADSFKVKIDRAIGFGGGYEPPMDNVSVADLYLPSPMNSRFHGDMIPVRTYFELKEREQGSNGVRFDYRHISAVEMKEMLEKQSIERLSFGFSKKDTKFEYNKIIFSGPCTIIIWKDGTKTMARVSKGDEFDPEKGVAICFMKRALGHTETNKTLKVADNMGHLKNTAFAGVDITQVTAKPDKT